MRFVLLPVLAVLVLPGDAVAASLRERTWATVNTCDTSRNPDRIGIRANMPGTRADDENMWMRIRVSWFDGQKWRMSERSDSRWFYLGRSDVRARQAGRNFRFLVGTGEAYTTRGLVNFQWRRDGKVVRRARRTTEDGHPTGRFADPRGYSESVCVIAG